MGSFLNRMNPPTLSPVVLDLDPADLTNLGCGKALDVFLHDFVTRTTAITGLVVMVKVGGSIAKAGRVQFTLEVEPTDLVAMSGLELSWLDCDTAITQFKLQGGTTSYFLLQVFSPGHLPKATSVGRSLLV